ncbi:EAL domain-containing protein [Niveispirillum sp. SYP-B3756]|uniref:putative bifunctional diguanylate cyclase/phosphodiesterase n=1 Tax=Niveispirillum sp. SYP-B3756 TaxID=2662178 RepID=UPI001291CF91|nr:EAL domain-containing protein [Niveispirillum sp. SYP-B3756]MQP67218.1 EAL domain-containing protein [Niveispirillum sp. SYP-B3756]
MRQALLILLSAVCIGVVLTAAEVAFTVHRKQTAAQSQLVQIMNLLEGPSRNALWNLDQTLADSIFGAATALESVGRVEIHDVSGTTFAATGEKPAMVSDFRRRMIAPYMTAERTLTRPGGTEVIGRLVLYLKPDSFIQDARATILGSVLLGLTRNLLLALLLSVIFHLFLTRPLIKLGRDLIRVKPDSPLANPIRVPRFHENDELGYVASRINELLAQLHRSQSELRRLATRDPLTNMPNRVLMTESLNGAVERAGQSGRALAVIFLDLDRFKHVNDSLGHAIGDALLRQVAERLQENLPAGHLAGRLGGDEFLIVLENMDGADEVTNLARRLLNALTRAYPIDGQILHVGASAGIAMYPGDGDDSISLMRHADVAMYAAKAMGGGTFKFFDRAMTERAMIILRTEASLRDALADDALHIHYQPKIDLETGAVAGAEALVRWNHAGRMISPAEFIPIAEETGLIIDLGYWVLTQVCRDTASWHRRLPGLSIAVNVSARQLAERDFADRAIAIVRRAGLSPSMFTLEVTESVVMRDVANQMVVLNTLRLAGFRIAVDDFGTGYSSLSYLRQLPVTMLKIDRSFVNDVPGDAAIAATVIALGKKLGLTTVAEGVETQEQYDWLRQEGCDQAQGYLISRPIPAMRFEKEFIDPNAGPLLRLVGTED